MRMSQEAVIAIVGVIVNLPAFGLFFWDFWRKHRPGVHRNRPGEYMRVIQQCRMPLVSFVLSLTQTQI